MRTRDHLTPAGFTEGSFFSFIHSMFPVDEYVLQSGKVAITITLITITITIFLSLLDAIDGASYPFRILKANNYSLIHVHRGNFEKSCKSNKIYNSISISIHIPISISP